MRPRLHPRELRLAAIARQNSAFLAAGIDTEMLASMQRQLPNSFRLTPPSRPMYYHRDGTPYTGTQEHQTLYWAMDLEKYDRRVALTRTPNGDTVSTVWLGLDHSFLNIGPPLIYETMIFSSTSLGGSTFRTPTEEAARAAHAEAVAMLEQELTGDGETKAEPCVESSSTPSQGTE